GRTDQDRETAILITPPGASPEEPWWTHRDREEELVAVARQVKADRRRQEAPSALERIAIVYKAPLPYLYVATEVFGSARIPFQTADTLPLAAEPVAAALDLILETVGANFTRDTLVALLRSPHFAMGPAADMDALQWRRSVSALDRALSDKRYL